MKYVLFVCTHNAGRSQMAQALFERYGPEDVRAESAGSDPAPRVWPEVAQVMRELDIDISGRFRLTKLLPGLIEEFGESRPPEVIRGCADRILEDYDDVPVRSHILTLAHKRTRECLRQEHCDVLEALVG